MFKSEENKRLNKDDIETIIGHTVKLEGDFVGDGDVIVEGIVNGNIATNKFLRVGENAQINAEISAQNAFISGEVNGNLKISNKLEVTSTAKIKGDIEAAQISIETGAIFNGKCQMSSATIEANESVEVEEENEDIE